jgi:DNA-binding response OmpR family regulator
VHWPRTRVAWPTSSNVRKRIVLAVRDRRLRQVLASTLRERGYVVDEQESAENLSNAGGDGGVVLLDWTAAGGLLAPEQRSSLRSLAGEVPLVLMVPGRWRHLLTAADLGVGGLLHKPFGEDALLDALDTTTALSPVQR